MTMMDRNQTLIVEMTGWFTMFASLMIWYYMVSNYDKISDIRPRPDYIVNMFFYGYLIGASIVLFARFSATKNLILIKFAFGSLGFFFSMLFLTYKANDILEFLDLKYKANGVIDGILKTNKTNIALILTTIICLLYILYMLLKRSR